MEEKLLLERALNAINSVQNGHWGTVIEAFTHIGNLMSFLHEKFRAFEDDSSAVVMAAMKADIAAAKEQSKPTVKPLGNDNGRSG